jgi:hypothetical protein
MDRWNIKNVNVTIYESMIDTDFHFLRALLMLPSPPARRAPESAQFPRPRPKLTCIGRIPDKNTVLIFMDVA